jgi:pre-rRNA-processing protein TSR3
MKPIATTVIRHAKERLAKCSLRFLHDRKEMTFLRQKPGFTFDGSGFLLLEVGAPTLSPADADRPLLLLDSTWRWLPQLRACVTGTPIPRSFPTAVATAYPRTSKVFTDPAAGLASIEALYLARALLGDRDPTLLDGYLWREQFLHNLAALGL